MHEYALLNADAGFIMMSKLSTPVKIHTPRLKLLSPRRSMAPAIADFFLRNRQHLAPWSPRMRDAFYTAAFQEEKIVKEQELLQQKSGLRFWLFALSDTHCEHVLGQIHFSNLVWGGFCSGFLGYSLCEQEQGKGYMTEALGASIQYVFDHWKLHRIEANIMPRNAPSIQVVKKLGFQCEGRSPKYLKINGQWEDHDHYVLRNLALE